MVPFAPDGNQRAHFLSTQSAFHLSVVVWAMLLLVALWPRFSELNVNIDILTVYYHNWVLVARLFGLSIQNPGSVNTSKDNKVEIA